MIDRVAKEMMFVPCRLDAGLPPEAVEGQRLDHTRILRSLLHTIRIDVRESRLDVPPAQFLSHFFISRNAPGGIPCLAWKQR